MKNQLSDKQIQHLYWRAGFGISTKELAKAKKLSKEKIVTQLFLKSKKSSFLTMDLSMLVGDKKTMSGDQKKVFRKLQKNKLFELNTLWVQQMISTEEVLREKVTLFFHNHFSVRLKNAPQNIQLNNTIRKHALGNFGTMLMEVSKSPAMIRFLNNRQNRKNRPNENFAREIMELFTLGRDNIYTEKDIKEAARAFTGWNYNKEGVFGFRKKHHDFGSKTFLSETGDFKGEDIIRILLQQRQTATFITKKIYKHFVNEKINEQHVAQLSETFYDANYDLTTLFKALFMSDWFYNEVNIGVHIKSPIELTVGLSRQFGVTYEDPKVLLFIQRKLNQTLFYPPNVAGWPGGRYWIDNSTLMLRLKLASVTLNSGVIEWSEKGDMPEDMLSEKPKNGKMTSQIEKKVKASPNWNNFLKQVKNKEKNQLIAFLLQPQLPNNTHEVVMNIAESSTKNFVVKLLSLPEYQLS